MLEGGSAYFTADPVFREVHENLLVGFILPFRDAVFSTRTDRKRDRGGTHVLHDDGSRCPRPSPLHDGGLKRALRKGHDAEEDEESDDRVIGLFLERWRLSFRHVRGEPYGLLYPPSLTSPLLFVEFSQGVAYQNASAGRPAFATRVTAGRADDKYVLHGALPEHPWKIFLFSPSRGIMFRMELDPHTLQQILQRIYQQMRCPQCGNRVPVDFSSVRVVAAGSLLLQLKCEDCNAFIVLHASIQGVDKMGIPEDVRPGIVNASSTLQLSSEEMSMLGQALEQSGGSFEKLFSTYGKKDSGTASS